MGADSLRILIGIAEATALGAFSTVSFSFLSSGEGDMPAGVDILSEKINSSRFMGSGWSLFRSDDFRS